MRKRETFVETQTGIELGEVLGLSPAEAAEMEFRAQLTTHLVRLIQAGRQTHQQIAEKAGTSRTRVTAIANANSLGISTDVLIRVLAAIGYRAELRLRKVA
jgi:predicted XRE-type DNA-binding protein